MDPQEAFDRLEKLSRLRAKLTVPRVVDTPGRREVVDAFTAAFTMIGGVPRLALWADQNPTEFYRLFGKLLPASSIVELARPAAKDLRSYTSEELQAMLDAERNPVVDFAERKAELRLIDVESDACQID